MVPLPPGGVLAVAFLVALGLIPLHDRADAGGLALRLLLLAGPVLAAGPGMAVIVAAVGAAAVGTTAQRHRSGLLDLAAAAAVVWAGIGARATGVRAADLILSVAWILAVTNIVVLLGRRATARGIVAVTLATLALTMSADTAGLGALACAGVGVAVALAVHRRCDGAILHGLGFLIGTLTVATGAFRAGGAPAILVVSLVLALPALEAAMVALGRLRRRRSITTPSRDHLADRLGARWASPLAAATAVVAIQVVVGSLAIAAELRLIPVAWAVMITFAALVGLFASASRARVYREAVVGLPRWFVRSFAAAVIGTGLISAPAVLALVFASHPARAGATSLEGGLGAVGRGQWDEATARVDRARAEFKRARGRLDRPLASLGLVVPGLSANLRAARSIAAIGAQLSTDAGGLAAALAAHPVQVRSGQVPIDEIRQLAPRLGDVARGLTSSRARLARVSRAGLLPALSEAVGQLRARLDRETGTAQRAAETARLAPDVFGAGGVRRYFLAFQNPDELRGTGGFIGNWGELVAEDGRLRLERFGRLGELDEVNRGARVLDVPKEFLDRWEGFSVDEDWRQVNVSPDFPTTARIITQLYPQSGGEPIDGVIAVDPPGLAALLELTGPVDVPNWPEPITASNVVEVTLRTAYERFADQADRVDFLGDVARRVWLAFISTDLGEPVRLARSLGNAARDGHLVTYSSHADEEALLHVLGADGSVPPADGDSLLVVNQNIAANKVDFYLRRQIRYDVQLQPGSGKAKLSGRLDVTLANGVPAFGLPANVVAPYDSRFAPGENRTYLSVYSPFGAASPTLDGKPVGLLSEPDLGRLANSTVVIVPSESSRTVSWQVGGELPLRGGWYHLDILRQPFLVPDDVEISIAVPPGWRIAETRGLTITGAHRAVTQFKLERPRVVSLRLERDVRVSIFDRIRPLKGA